MGQPLVVWDEDKEWYVIQRELRWTTPSGCEVVVPPGFTCDGATWAHDCLCLPSEVEKWVLHDYMYSPLCDVSRADADAVFRRGLSYLRWVAVRLFGGRYYRTYTPPQTPSQDAPATP